MRQQRSGFVAAIYILQQQPEIALCDERFYMTSTASFQSHIQAITKKSLSRLHLSDVTIDAAKRYPTGRQASQQRPQGSVKLWFVLNRTGALVELGVFLGDASFLLEDAAKAAVRRSSFPPFPAGAWPSDEQHKFTTELNFVPPSGS